MLKFEHRRQPLLPKKHFKERLLLHAGLAVGAVTVALGVGVLGYHFLAGFAWVDALLDASMILSGMGPVGELHTDTAKVFASFYALFSGITFISTVGLLFAPIVHRFFHQFHLDQESPSPPEKKPPHQ